MGFCAGSGQQLRAALFQEGIVRICAEPYEAASRSNLHKIATHLTNTAVSSLHRNGNANSCTETLSQLAGRIGVDAWANIWEAIKQILGRLMELCQPHVAAVP